MNNVRKNCKENLWTNSTNKQQFACEVLPPEKGFRGFEKSPRVLCERIDITPYLVNRKTENIVMQSRNSIVKTLDKMFSLSCSVILVREDLEKLKEIYNNKNISKNAVSNLIKCKHCDKIYTTEKRLKNHIDSKHRVIYKPEFKPQKRVSFSDQVIVHELKEYHHCRKCPRLYENYNSLKVHMKQEHKKRKCYVCFYCNKDFVDRMFFKVHIKMHCSLCGKFFVSKKVYNDHRRTVCRILKSYPCKVCNEIYFSFLTLKDHSFSHEGAIFVCDICKDRFNSKCLLLHHIQFLHCKRHPKALYDTVHIGTNIMYECNSCEQCSNNKDIMENHTTLLPDLKNSIMTGYKDYYFCDQCSEQFDTETKMLCHKWTHFLKTSKNSSNVNDKGSLKMTYKVGEELPLCLQPKLVIKQIEVFAKRTKDERNKKNNLSKNNAGTEISKFIGASSPITTLNNNNNNQEVNDVLNLDDLKNMINNVPQKTIKDPVSKKTLLSKHQCQYCLTYLSTGYCLRRHIQAVHMRTENLQCTNCEEVFVTSALLRSHNCIRMNIPEMPFDDARPEIQFDNLHEFCSNNASSEAPDELDFDIPAPIVELTEFDNLNLVVNNEGTVSCNSAKTLDTMGYKITLQEVPIEF